MTSIYKKLHGLSGHEFEGFIYELIQREKHNPESKYHNWNQLEVTKKSKDGGKDIIGNASDGQTIWVECKRHRDAVSYSTVKSSLTKAAENGVDMLYIVALRITSDSKRKIQRKSNVEVKFLTKNSLVSLIKNSGTNRYLLNLYYKYTGKRLDLWDFDTKDVIHLRCSMMDGIKVDDSRLIDYIYDSKNPSRIFSYLEFLSGNPVHEYSTSDWLESQVPSFSQIFNFSVEFDRSFAQFPQV